MKEYGAMQKQYDRETHHYCIEEEQERWNKKIEEMIIDYHEYW